MLKKIQFKITNFLFNRKWPNHISSNIYDTVYDKRALLSYLPKAFDYENASLRHTSILECRAAGEIFKKLGYQVDVVHYGINCNVDWQRYDIVYGMGWALEKAFFCERAEEIKKIFYATGCNPIYAEIQTLKKAAEFFVTTGSLIPGSTRITKNNWKGQVFLSDAIIVLGNGFVESTYREHNVFSKIFKLNAFYLENSSVADRSEKTGDWKHNFLWFGSGGLLHKGLDILINYFSHHSNLKLHICGASHREKKFFDHFNDKIERCANIIDHGFVDVNSSAFLDLMKICGAVVFPSVSEGGAPAILTVMAHGGLIPIISKSSGLDLEIKDFEFYPPNHNNFSVSINKYLDTDELRLMDMSKMIQHKTRSNYTYDIYKSNLERIISKVLK